MTDADFSSLALEELVQLFGQTANLLGTVVKLSANPDPEKFKQTPERAARIETMRAISAEFRARNARARIRALFDDPDVEIRAWAAGQFILFDPEWASAAFSGIYDNLRTVEVLTYRKRARIGDKWF